VIANIFDTETTGLIDNPARRIDIQPECISIAIIKVNLLNGNIIDEYYNVFKPSKRISEEITRITGFTNEMLVNKPSIEAHLDEIINRLIDCKLIIGQNISFDMGIVEFECKRYNRNIKWPSKINIVQHAIFLKGYRLKLNDLHMELFGSNFENAHNALEDAKATAKIATEMYRKGLL